MRELKLHHAAWLSVHQNRTEEWLREKFQEGFDVHHIDGDHDNNDPLNLVLIEHTDHMLLHAGFRMTKRGFHKGKKYIVKKKKKATSKIRDKDRPIDLRLGRRVNFLLQNNVISKRFVAAQLQVPIGYMMRCRTEYLQLQKENG